MPAWLADPWIQSAGVPLAVGLAVAALGFPLRLSGLAAAAGFLAAVYLRGQLSFEPVNPMRKLVLVGAIVAPLLGVMLDLAFRPTRAAGIVLGALFGLAALWVFSGLLGAKPT